MVRISCHLHAKYLTERDVKMHLNERLWSTVRSLLYNDEYWEMYCSFWETYYEDIKGSREKLKRNIITISVFGKLFDHFGNFRIWRQIEKQIEKGRYYYGYQVWESYDKEKKWKEREIKVMMDGNYW